MAETISTKIKRKLKDGYSIVSWSDNKQVVFNHSTEEYVTDPLREDSYLPIVWADVQDEHGRFYQNVLASLRRAGVLDEPTRSSDPSRRRARTVSHKEPKNAVIIAQETLRDSTASPRERALARNYLELIESHNAVRELARKLGQRLKELEKLID